VFVVAAWASGAVHLSSTAIWIGAGVAVAFGIWQASVDRELGRRIASAQIWPSLTAVVALAFVITMIAPPFFVGFANGYNGDAKRAVVLSAANPGNYWWSSSFTWNVAWSLVLGVLCLRWRLREKWAGRLLLEASSRRSRFFLGAMLIISLFGSVANSTGRSGKVNLDQEPTGTIPRATLRGWNHLTVCSLVLAVFAQLPGSGGNNG
jgi:hypothetical protein